MELHDYAQLNVLKSLHVHKFGEDRYPHLQNPTGCLGPKMCENGKQAIWKLITLKQLKIEPHNLRVESSTKSSFFMPIWQSFV